MERFSADVPQRILVVQQDGKGERKAAGIRQYGQGRFRVHVISLPVALPPILDDTSDLLPDVRDNDLVLDFLVHPDLSIDLARACLARSIPVIASGKKLDVPGVFTPPI
jgi:hypothetical protein